FEGDSIEAVEVCSGLTFAEGPVWVDARGSLFFSDFQIGRADLNFTGRIVEYVPRGGCTTFLDDFGSNGLGLHSDGRVLACRHDDQTVSALDPASGELEVLVSDLDGTAFSSPNDVTMRSDGNLYFTDPAWQVGDRPELLPQRAYRRDPSGTVHVIDDIPRANGITLSPDETRLYVSDQGSVRVYDLADDGATGTSASFVSSGSDGMAVDCAGNLYITTGGEVRVFAPDGQALGAITLPGGADGTTNVAFGGADRLTLYITGPSALYAVGLAIPGWPF
ncbi:MAG: SMP-30/gluconolactonase/LRE family protein, partial [Myxococcales bacterium]|nr:SMP-30/gluconolactonase/LRE family protein [Myxococcales bacterium]